jgi:hypothetical protein
MTSSAAYNQWYKYNITTGGNSDWKIRWLKDEDQHRDNQTWYQWNNTYTTTTSTTTAIWEDWITRTNTNITTTTGATYPLRDYLWGSTEVRSPIIRSHQRFDRTDAEWAQIEREQAEARAERDRLTTAARTNASQLLALVLDASQQMMLAAKQYFEVVGSSGQLWRVHYGTSGNVKAIGIDGQEIMAICAHPAMRDQKRGGYLPTEDVMAGQALGLMHDDASFLRIANIHRGAHRRLELVPALRAA